MIYVINFLLAISTTVGMTIIPILVTESLSLSYLTLGLIEGSTEFLSSILRLVNGVLFDKLKNKRYIFAVATTLALLAKMILLVPQSATIILSKVLERMSNGAFAAPRDAYVAERSTQRGIALGLIGVSKSAGCILGPLLVSCAAYWWDGLAGNETRLIAFCCLLVLPALVMSFRLDVKTLAKSDFSIQEFWQICRGISPILMIAFVFFMGRFNDGLLVIYLKRQGFPEWFYLSTISIFNFTMMIAAPVIGRSIDIGKIRQAYVVSLGSLTVFGSCFYFLESVAWGLAIVGLISWGIQRTGAQIVFTAMIFRSVKEKDFGTAVGAFHLVSGFATMLASMFCGILAKERFDHVALFSLTFSILALMLTPRVLSKSQALA